MSKIKAIYCPEPLRVGELPVAHVVGFDGVTHIHEIEDNFGTYGIRWYSVNHGTHEAARVNALYVAQVDFVKEDKADA